MTRDDTTRVLGALALELVPGSDAGRDQLPQAEAGTLASLVAGDLARFHAPAAGLECAMVAAHYDPVELLRPGWPIHEELHQLAARAPGAGLVPGQGRIVAFGSHAGQLPGVLAPSPDHRGGSLRLVPFVLSGGEAVAAAASAHFEQALMEQGMASAATALAAQEAFGLRIEHARYLTMHDLCAMTALQYEHAGLAPLWPILESALLSPGREEWLDAPPEPLVHYTGDEARIALFSPDAWRERSMPAVDGSEVGRLERAFAHFEARQRQFAAVLQAHAVPVLFMHCAEATAPGL